MTSSPHIDGRGAAAAGAFPFRIPKQATVSGAGLDTGLHTYRAAGTGYAGYATPTDMLTIRGAANKLVLVTAFLMQIQSTAAALQTLYFIRRSTLNTGGTSTQPSAVKFDSASPAAAAQVDLYSVIPDALGDSAGTLGIGLVASTTIANAPSTNNVHTASALLLPGNVGDLRRPITLRENECLCINYNGAALTAGFAATWLVEWAETDA